MVRGGQWQADGFGGERLMRRVVFTADDFGLDVAVNEAVELAYREGVLTTADLMMGQPATEDAVLRAGRLPGLAVGLHLAVTKASGVLPPSVRAHWTTADGALPVSPVGAALRVLHPAARDALRHEIVAQFQAFSDTGLVLDHVSVHQHLHLHPVIRNLIFEVGRTYGMTAIRVPREPACIAFKAGMRPRWGEYLVTRPWVMALRGTAQRLGVGYTRFVWGNAASGHLTAARLHRLLEHLPPGTHEIYCHPASRSTAALERQARGYERVAELAALCDPRTREALARYGLERTTYRGITQNRGAV
jgi:hopanoid biosynthesis associated protein HpnK